MAEVYEIHCMGDIGWRIEENGVRSFLLTGCEKAALIDTGLGAGDILQVVKKLTPLPVMLINTHADRDHIGGNGLFDEAWMHPAEFDRYQFGQGTKAIPKALWEGDVVELGGRSLEVILIPGHTPGSIALLDRQGRILFGGDSVQAGTIYMFGPGRNMEAYIASMEKLAAMKALIDEIYPSHGPLPVKPEILDGLLIGARQMLKGEIPPAHTTLRDAPMTVYDIGVAGFYYQGGK